MTRSPHGSSHGSPQASPRRSARAALLVSLLAAGLAACTPVAKVPAPGLMDVAERPAERSLLAGLRAYDDGQYAQAEAQLDQSLQAGLASPRDRAAAYKHLAFIYCTSERTERCEQAFRAARGADPAFALGKAEAGHPVWGPVYRRVLP